MKITPGEWRTRDGRKAIVAARHPEGNVAYPIVGWVGDSAECWTEDGKWHVDDDCAPETDLVAPWIEPVQWDWSTTPQWLNCLIQGPSGHWYLCEAGVYVGNDGLLFNGSKSIRVPEEYAPKWSGDWRKSKTMRPGYNGGTK